MNFDNKYVREATVAGICVLRDNECLPPLDSVKSRATLRTVPPFGPHRDDDAIQQIHTIHRMAGSLPLGQALILTPFIRTTWQKGVRGCVPLWVQGAKGAVVCVWPEKKRKI